MLLRTFTVLLAMVLFWSAMATQERFALAADAQASMEQVAASTPDGRQRGGSVDEHHLDDQPGQLNLEHTSDLPVWFPATRSLIEPNPGRLSHVATGFSGRLPNVPDVLLRPPRA